MNHTLAEQPPQVTDDQIVGTAILMTVRQAQKSGLQAFKDGFARAPVLNKEFTAAAYASSTELVDLLEGYLHGWTIGMLAENTSPDFPSAIERARIEGA